MIMFSLITSFTCFELQSWAQSDLAWPQLRGFTLPQLTLTWAQASLGILDETLPQSELIWLMTIYTGHLISVYLRQIYLRRPPPPQICLTRSIGKARALISLCKWRESCTKTPGNPSNLWKAPPPVVESVIHVPSLINKRANYTWHGGHGESTLSPHHKVTLRQVHFIDPHKVCCGSSKSRSVH